MHAGEEAYITPNVEEDIEQFTVELRADADRAKPLGRMDVFLRERYPQHSRSAFQRLIEEGCLTVNGRATRATYTPRVGDVVEIRWPEPESLECGPEDIPLDVLFEDEHLVVINKAAGICVHPSLGHRDHTVVNALLHHCAGQLSGIGGVARPGIVHRLDMDTTGALIVAKDDLSHQGLVQQFTERTTEKFYLAIVCGNDLPAEGRIDVPIERSQGDRKKMAAFPESSTARSALTTYCVVQRGEYAALVRAQIHTGRTHQVRVHLKYIGYPLVGDARYGERQNAHLVKMTGYQAQRQMLHAWRLAFTHPCTGERIQVTAPLPQDMIEGIVTLTGKPFSE